MGEKYWRMLDSRNLFIKKVSTKVMEGDGKESSNRKESRRENIINRCSKC